jgi:hypothetical protein
MFKTATLTLLVLLAPEPCPAADDAARMLARADAPRDAFGEGVMDVQAIVTEHQEAPVESRLTLYAKGTDKSLAIFREGKQKDRKILTDGDKVWLIVPGASRPVPVSKSQRLMGAASFGDIARLRFADEYTGVLRSEDETVGNTPCHVLDLTAKRKGAAYPTGVLWLSTSDGLARRLRLTLASKKPAKEVAFTGYGEHGWVRTMEIHDLLSKGGDNVTTLTFARYEPKPLDPSMFDPEGAKSVP